MTIQNDLQSLKTIAKRIAREKRIPHHEALDIVAKNLGHPHWNALTAACGKGWQPQSSAVEALAELSNDADVMKIPVVGIGQGVKRDGFINGHPYSLEIDFEVLMAGNGRSILLEHAPSEKPVIEIYDQRKDNPIRNPEFREQALAICYDAAERLRNRIAADWPRRSTKPDADGQAQHPLRKGLSSTWHCLHCDGTFTGPQMAGNMWHCPNCNATPIDIFITPFWRAASEIESGVSNSS
jgi:hypothetical protein